eukprot:198166_1
MVNLIIKHANVIILVFPVQMIILLLLTSVHYSYENVVTNNPIDIIIDNVNVPYLDLDTTDLRIFLMQYTNRTDKQIFLIPNPGNAGDVLINYGQMLFFSSVGLQYQLGDPFTKYKNSIIFFGGGGSFVNMYTLTTEFFRRNMKQTLNNEIILLPHTIKDRNIIKRFGPNIILFARELVSYNYIKTLSNHKNNMYLSKDMAFYIGDINKLNEYNNKNGIMHNKYGNSSDSILNVFRNDSEKTSITIPENNVDLSLKFIIGHYGSFFNGTMDVNHSSKIVTELIEYMSNYSIIYTNRLHIAILSSLFNKTCYL